MRNPIILVCISVLSLMACKKDNTTVIIENKDSIVSVDSGDITENIDSSAIKEKDSIINNAPLTKEVLATGVMREIKNRKIIRKVDAERLPQTIGEEFTDDTKELILKISNFPNKKLSAKINTEEKDFNIRFNQIKTPNGKLDGPFGREFTYDIPSNGEITLIIGKSNMASGKVTGHFSVTIE